MPRPLRTDLPDGIFHVTARGVDGAPIFRDDDDRRSFLRLLRETVTRYRWACHAFCLMTNHYHLVLEARQPDLSLGIQRLNGTHAQRFNRRHGRTGHLFGARYASWVVDSEAHFRATCRYVLLNPVRAGLCDRARDWPWSSARAH